jgi:hypothetical protein
MPETSLVVIDPGHFHATLVQQQMYPELSPIVRVYAPLGPDLIDYLSRIARSQPATASGYRLAARCACRRRFSRSDTG